MDFLVGIKKYVYIGVALLVVILAGTAYFLYKQTLKEAGSAAVANSVNQGNTAVAEKKDEGDKITSKTNEDNNQKQEENKDATQTVVSTATEKKKAAERTYEAGPKTPEATAQRDEAVDRADIDSLWDAFCVGKPASPGCVKEVSK